MLKRFITGSTLSLILLSSLTQIVHAAEGSIFLGRYGTMLSIGSSTKNTGSFFNGRFLYNNIKSNVFDIGVGYNININSFQISPSIKTIFNKYEESLAETTMSLGLGAKARYKFNSHWSIYGQYNYAKECCALKTIRNSYQEINSGISYTPISVLSLELGYRYIRLNNNSPSKSYRSTEYLTKTPYLGVSMVF
ncbi:YfaZ family outer membrane protein [Pantoea sp. SoEX]|uniref:YfaZ family outer membrane protein n=1 Tax=Pantoea sp. SoEX TaxID=2576763 RepID=UPI00135AEAB8|nr:YfaZ family outer membrane protein [Pantoea sp. SoEX]MXP51072.1 hypothetical protein [Pantoea sp. SoEX]